MLQGLNESSKSSDSQRVQNPNLTNQHGYDEPSSLLSNRPDAGYGRAQDGQTTSSPGDGGGGEDTTPSPSTIETGVGRLNPSRRRTGSPVDKIWEHENASSRKESKHDGFFARELASSRKGSTAGQTSLSDLSNGMSILPKADMAC